MVRYGCATLRLVVYGCVWVCMVVCVYSCRGSGHCGGGCHDCCGRGIFLRFRCCCLLRDRFDHPVLASMWLWSSWLLYLKCHRLRRCRGSAGFGGGVWSFRLLLQVVAIHAHFSLSNAGVFGAVTIFFRIGLTFFFHRRHAMINSNHFNSSFKSLFKPFPQTGNGPENAQ